MFFERRKEQQPAPIEINEDERRRSTDRVLNDTVDILNMSEVQDALERLNMGRLPGLLDQVYVPTIENGEVDANRRDFVPIVSLYPREKLSFKDPERSIPTSENIISLNTNGEDADGVTLMKPQTLVALPQARHTHVSAPLSTIHELAHVHQQSHPVNPAAYERFPYLGSPGEVEALNVEAVVARVLSKSRNTKWSKNSKLFNEITRHINSQQRPVIPEKEFHL
jgi:hypothetical protein